MKKKPAADLQTCPCGSGRNFEHCCQPYLQGHAQPAGVEALMRSRYCAYALKHSDYVLASWHASTRPVTLNIPESSPLKWIDLQVHEVKQGTTHGEVYFSARYKENGRMYTLREHSRFVFENSQWYYVDGDEEP